MMKKLIMPILLSTIITYNSSGQTDTYLRLYANMGLQLNNFDNTFNTNHTSNIYPFQLGAGSNYKFGRFVIGTEFYNSNGESKNNLYRINYKEFTSTLYLGYDLLKSSNISLEPNIGFFMGNKQSIIYDLQNTVSHNYNVNQIGISPSITLTKFNSSGISTGLKIGVNYPLNNSNWNNGIDNSKTLFNTNTITPFIQLNMGGRIKLKKKQKISQLKKKEKANQNSSQILLQNKSATLNTIVYPKSNAETIILLHGGPGVPNEMKEIAILLNKNYQVIYFDQRGTGKSTCTNCSFTMNDYVSDIEVIANDYQLEKFHLFGHSWGGLYAQIYTDSFPTKIQSLFLCSPSSGTSTTWKRTEKEVMKFNKQMTSTGEWLKMGWNSLLGILGSDKAYRRLFNQVYKNYNKDFQDILIKEEELDGVFAEPINKTLKEIKRYKSLPKIKKPNFPICITYGEKDIYGDSKKKLLERFPTGKVFIVKNCGHIPWLHNPIEFNKIINEFYNLQK